MKNHSCCFTGHRWLPKEKLGQILKRLDLEVENLINQGVAEFVSGGALGFDQIAASLIVTKKKIHPKIRLILALPCKNQDARWNDEQKRLYCGLFTEADEVIYVSEEYFDGCMAARNRYMVDRTAYCICAQLRSRSGTGQTVRYMREQGLWIINVAE